MSGCKKEQGQDKAKDTSACRQLVAVIWVCQPINLQPALPTETQLPIIMNLHNGLLFNLQKSKAVTFNEYIILENDFFTPKAFFWMRNINENQLIMSQKCIKFSQNIRFFKIKLA